MNMRNAVFAAAVTVLMVAASCAVLASDDASADPTVDFRNYYYDQLDENSQEVYKAFYDQSMPTTVTKGHEGEGPGYDVYFIHMEVTLANAVDGLLALDEVRAGWQATKLEDPYAYWAWSYDSAEAAIREVAVNGTTAEFNVYVSEAYAKLETESSSSGGV